MKHPLSEKENFLQEIPVSHETIEKLDRYADLLIEWNKKFNLVAASTLEHIWQRHFLDSAQLAKFIPNGTRTLADLGSGAGFPGMVLALMGAAKEIHLIESTGKKAEFLRHTGETLSVNVVVNNCRAESIQDQRFDVITARAAAPLNDLLKLSKSLIKKDSLCLFLKGRNADMELTESKKYWTFGCEKIPSSSDSSGNVLIIKNIKPKNAAPHKRR